MLPILHHLGDAHGPASNHMTKQESLTRACILHSSYNFLRTSARLTLHKSRISPPDSKDERLSLKRVLRNCQAEGSLGHQNLESCHHNHHSVVAFWPSADRTKVTSYPILTSALESELWKLALLHHVCLDGPAPKLLLMIHWFNAVALEVRLMFGHVFWPVVPSLAELVE
jgi:hypothetical protein